MGVLDTIRSWFGGQARSLPPPLPSLGQDEPEPEAPEIDADALKSALVSATPPVLLDVRELFEWRQARIPDALHIPLNQIPLRLASLPKDRKIVVFCAHGSRSYGATVYLNEQGY